MTDHYRATAAADRAERLAATDSPFAIDVRFVGGLTQRQRAAFSKAADRWVRVIVGDLPSVRVDGETVDDVLIVAEGATVDGPGQVLGQAGPTHLRPQNVGASALLPARGEMTFDAADLAEMEADGTLDDVVTHEMGHVLGFGTLWAQKRLLAGSGTADPTFTGAVAVAEYNALGGSGAVPVENVGGPGTREGHWRESVFGNELMSGFIREPGNPLSRITAGSLADLGYQVDLDAAEDYRLPTRPQVREPARGHRGRGTVIPPVPVVLPEASLIG